MGFTEGVVWSLLGAVAHTIIDVLRKFGAQRLPPADLISLLTIYNAAFAVLGLALVDGHLPRVADIPNPHLFVTAVVATAAMGLVAALLYQRAVSIAPLSLTVPYLAFAPVFVVFVSPLFLVGEVPSAMGLVGVTIVSIAGYRLGLMGARDTAAAAAAAAAAGGGAAAAAAHKAHHHHHHPSSPSKVRAGSGPLLLADLEGPAVGGQQQQHRCGGGGGGDRAQQDDQLLLAQRLRQQQQQQLHVQVHLHTAGAGHGRAAGGQQAQQQQQSTGQQGPQQALPLQQQHSSLHLRQTAQLQPHAGDPEPLGAAWRDGDAAAGGEQQPLLPLQQQHPQPGQGQGQQQQHGARSSGGGGRVRQKSSWAESYYKAAAQLLPSSTSAGGSPRHAATHHRGAAAGAHAAGGMSNGGGGAAGHFGAAGGSGGGGCASDGGDGSSGGGSWADDSQAKGAKEGKPGDGKRSALLLHASAAAAAAGGAGAGFPASRRRRLPRWLRLRGAPLLLLQRAQRLLAGPGAGPAMVLAVAFLYSVTASLDKLGMSAAPSTAFYIVCQRLLIAAASLTYLLAASPGTLRHLGRDAVLLVSMSLVEQAAVVLYFKAIQNILVSYMVAIKRINVLLSTLIGCFMFGERVGRRIPYILLMLCGMLLLLFQPGHEALHHSHHTH